MLQRTERPVGRWVRPGKTLRRERRAAVAVSGEAAERPMEPEAIRAHCCVFAVPISPGLYWLCGKLTDRRGTFW